MFKLNNTKFVLASSSPRRKELLSSLGFEFEIIKPDTEEAVKEGESPKDYVLRNAFEKAEAVVKQACIKQSCIYLAADTIVVLDNLILEKPHTETRAIKMLKQISGKKHTVFTGCCFATHGANDSNVKYNPFIVESNVFIKNLNEQEILNYVATKEPLDKAGSYAVQGLGNYMVQRIEGSYTNVVGLPMTEVFEFLEKSLI